MSEIENDERFIGIFYKEREPTGNDFPDNLEVTGHENQIDDSFKLANLVRRTSKIKSKRKTPLEFDFLITLLKNVFVGNN
mgnify:CR=1 FL=1